MLALAAVLIAAADPTPVPIAPPAPEVIEQIQETRAGISADDKRSREELSHLFVINQKIKEAAREQAKISQRRWSLETNVRNLAREVGELETRSERQKDALNRRLRQLYQGGAAGNDLALLFSARSMKELERHHRFMRLMVDSDHRLLKRYLVELRVLTDKRNQLKGVVARLAAAQREAQDQEAALGAQLHEKSKLLGDIKSKRAQKVTQLKGLRDQTQAAPAVLPLAFFERKGGLPAPVEASLKREYGSFTDPKFRFHLVHKGFFYNSQEGSPVYAVHAGEVAFANPLPGFGKAVIIDHGDNYYSVYAFVSKLHVRQGNTVKEGDAIAVTGESSPLFGPGLYFEIRHFTDAIDPRPWIKDSVIKTADTNR